MFQVDYKFNSISVKTFSLLFYGDYVSDYNFGQDQLSSNQQRFKEVTGVYFPKCQLLVVYNQQHVSLLKKEMSCINVCRL